MNEVRIGIIGLGGMGEAHCRTFMEGKIGRARLTAVAAHNPARRAWAEQSLPSDVKVFDDDIGLIRSGCVDAVMIEVPHYQHPRIAIDAFEHGLHVLCDKPAGVYTAQVRKMNAAADEHPELAFGMIFNQRTDPKFKKLHEIVQNKEFGDIKRVNWIITDWYRPQAYFDSGSWRGTWDGEGGGVLLNQCCHNIDLMQWICGMPEMIRAFCHFGKWHDIEVEDDVTAYMEFPGGATGVLVTTTGQIPGVNRLEIDFSKGQIVCEGSGISAYRTEDEREFNKSATEGFAKLPAGPVSIDIDGEYPKHPGVIRAFVDHILDGTPMIADGREGMNSLMIINAMYLSTWLGRPVSLPLDDELYLQELNKRRGR